LVKNCSAAGGIFSKLRRIRHQGKSNMKSSWEETKKRSQYHFDPMAMDSRWDTVIKLGQFQGDWSS
jgi:hypothetical protein